MHGLKALAKRNPIVFLGLFIVITTLLWGLANARSERGGNVVASVAGPPEAELECPPEDMIQGGHYDYAPPDNPAFPPTRNQVTPSEALRRGLTRVYPKLEPGAFRKTGASSHGGEEYVYERNGAVVVRVLIFQYDDNIWAVSGYEACNSVLAESSSKASR